MFAEILRAIQPELVCGHEDCDEPTFFAIAMNLMDNGLPLDEQMVIPLCPEHVAAFLRDSIQADMAIF